MSLQLICKQVVGIQMINLNLPISQKAYRKRTFYDTEYSKVTANMTNPSTMPSRSRGKQLVVSSDVSDDEPEEVYRHTRTQTGVVAPVDYSALARGIEVSESHSAIAESQASNSSVEKEAFVYMANTPEETTRRFEQQAQVQREQLDMIRA